LNPKSNRGNKFYKRTMHSHFEFYPGEYLVGHIIINPNKNKTKRSDKQEF